MDRNFTILLAIVIICFTVGSFRACQNEHELKIKCLEVGHFFYPNGQCQLKEEKQK